MGLYISYGCFFRNFRHVNTKKGHITSITFSILIILLISVLSSSVSAHSLVLENSRQSGTEHELTTQKIISGDGLLVNPIKISESNTVNYQSSYKQYYYTDRYSSATHLRLQIAYAQYFSSRQNDFFSSPIYIVFRSLLI